MSRLRPASRLVLALVILAALGAGGAGAEPPAGRVEPGDGPVVVDAGGQVVGPLVSTLGGLPITLVRLRLGSRDVLVTVTNGAVRGLLAYQFESVDCTGTPYLNFAFPPELKAGLLEVAAISPSGDVQVPDGILLSRNIQSELGTLFDPGCDTIGPGFQDVRAPLTVGTVNGFTAPFRLRRE